jgi:hypothetical protein
VSPARFLAIARLELRTHLRGPLFWTLIAFVAFATASINPDAFIRSESGVAGTVRPFVNSQHAMAQLFSLSGFLFYTFFATIMAGMAVIRDDEARISDLLRSTPLTPAEYVLGKFAGVAAALAVALALHLSLAIGWYQFGGVDAVRGPFRLANYAMPALAFVAPATLTHVDLDVDLVPEARRMRVEGAFTLVHRSKEAMRRLPVTVGQSFEWVQWAVDGAEIASDDRSGLHVLTLPTPLNVDERVRVGFAYHAVFPRGSTRNGGGVSEFVLPSGVVLHTLGPNLMPIPGFVEGIGVDGENRSEPRELPDDNPDHPSLHDLIESLRPHATDPVAYQAFVDRWFLGVVVPEYRIADAVAARTEKGWEVSATIENVGTGAATVEVAASKGERFPGRDRASYYAEARATALVEPGRPQRVSWTLEFEPERLVVDPDALVLQLNRDRAMATF